MRYIQSAMFAVASLLLIWAAIQSFGIAASNPFAVIWALQFLGIGSVLGFLAFGAISPDKPAMLKKKS